MKIQYFSINLKFYNLRILLHVVRSLTSPVNFKIVDNIHYYTFQPIGRPLGLHNDENNSRIKRK